MPKKRNEDNYNPPFDLPYEMLQEHDGIGVERHLFPSRVRVVRKGADTRVFCATTGDEFLGFKTVKTDLSPRKTSTCKITIEVDVADIVFLDDQLDLFGTEGDA